MENQALYNAIFTRRSVRKYETTPLSADERLALQRFIDTVKPLDDTIQVAWTLIDHGDVSDPFHIKSPHYLCLYSEEKGPYLMNAGFLLQQVDLYLSAQGLGSCWLGLAKPSRHARHAATGLEYVIMLAFGKASVPVHRSSTAEFNRKSLADMTTLPGASDLLEPVRLAPSASNTQPWYFTGDRGNFRVWRKKQNLIQAALYHRMNQIDIGIALCHLWFALDHQGKQAAFSFEPEHSLAGYDWMAKVMVEG